VRNPLSKGFMHKLRKRFGRGHAFLHSAKSCKFQVPSPKMQSSKFQVAQKSRRALTLGVGVHVDGASGGVGWGTVRVRWNVMSVKPETLAAVLG
jgi:hypothetical protein